MESPNSFIDRSLDVGDVFDRKSFAEHFTSRGRTQRNSKQTLKTVYISGNSLKSNCWAERQDYFQEKTEEILKKTTILGMKEKDRFLRLSEFQQILKKTKQKFLEKIKKRSRNLKTLFRKDIKFSTLGEGIDI